MRRERRVGKVTRDDINRLWDSLELVEDCHNRLCNRETTRDAKIAQTVSKTQFRNDIKDIDINSLRTMLQSVENSNSIQEMAGAMLRSLEREQEKSP